LFELLVRLNPAPAPMMRSGGKPELTAADIAAACYGTDKLGLDILLAKIAGREIRLHERILKLVNKLSDSECWKARNRPERLQGLASLVILEYICEPRCPLCHGTKYYQAALCEPCKGIGYIRLNDKARAVAIGVVPSVWLRTWKGRYARIVQEIDQLESNAVSTICRHLKG